jgi:hypothetical protein
MLVGECESVNVDKSVSNVNVKLRLLVKVWQDGSLFRLFTAGKISSESWSIVSCE